MFVIFNHISLLHLKMQQANVVSRKYQEKEFSISFWLTEIVYYGQHCFKIVIHLVKELVVALV